MDVLDKLYTEWAWRSKSGTPTISNPEDKSILDELIKELTDNTPIEETPVDNTEVLITEVSSNYDKEILKALNVDTIPPVKGRYTVPSSGGRLHIKDEEDAKIFRQIYPHAPDQSIGPGELALYWLFQHQQSSVDTVDNRGGDKPDLKIGDDMVEVKAYGHHTGKIKLGRFSKQRKELRMLNIVFGLSTLQRVLNLESTKKVITTSNFKADELVEAFSYFFKFKQSPGLLEAADKFELIKDIKEKVESVDRILHDPETPERAASLLLSKIIETKFELKPGNGGYIASVLPNADVHFFYIDFKKLRAADLLKHSSIVDGNIAVDFMAVFG